MPDHVSPPDLEIAKRLLDHVLNPMKQTFVGKDEIIDLLGISLVANENLFLLGPPGTAKSALVNDLCRRLQGTSFEYLLTRFTEPNEIFGPFDITKLREGVLVTNTEGMLPESSLAFLDELLNANSAILNSLLTVLNERVFRRGRETIKIPTLMIVGASNHLPEDEALRALFDRFLLRVQCVGVPDDDLGAVLDAGWKLERDATSDQAPAVTVEDIRRLSELVPHVSLEEIRPAYLELVLRLRRAGLDISDRRAVKLQGLMAASALMCGRMNVLISDLWILRYIWEAEEEVELLDRLVTDAIQDGDPATAHPNARTDRRVDPERLQAALDSLATAETVDPKHLQAIDNDLQWIDNEVQRSHLASQVERLRQNASRGNGM